MALWSSCCDRLCLIVPCLYSRVKHRRRQQPERIALRSRPLRSLDLSPCRVVQYVVIFSTHLPRRGGSIKNSRVQQVFDIDFSLCTPKQTEYVHSESIPENDPAVSHADRDKYLLVILTTAVIFFPQ